MKGGVQLREEMGLVRGFFFVDCKGKKLSIMVLEGYILRRIARMQQDYPDLIRSTIDLHENYGLSRSFRRGSNSEAQNRRFRH